MNIEWVTTHDLRRGDVIISNGMSLLIDTEPRQTSHPVTEHGGKTFAVAAGVLNYDVLVERGRADDAVARYLLRFINDDMHPKGLRARNALPPYTEPRWVIQGNGLAEWARVIKEDN